MSSYATISVNTVDNSTDFQHALAPLLLNSTDQSQYNISLQFNTWACSVGNGVQNCSQACEDPRYLFNSTSTIQNCVTLGYAATYAANATLFSELDDSDYAVDFVGVNSIHHFNVSAFTGNLLACTAAACTNTSVGWCSLKIPSSLSELSSSNTQEPMLLHALSYITGDHQFCAGVVAQANGDIAGPGVRFTLPSTALGPRRSTCATR